MAYTNVGKPVNGSELITNGNFTGAATGWTLGTGWAYSSNNVLHTAGNVAALSQVITTTENGLYVITFSIGGTAGTVVVSLGSGKRTLNAGAGSVEIILESLSSTALAFTPSTDFDGTIDTVSVKQLVATTKVARPTSSYTHIARP